MNTSFYIFRKYLFTMVDFSKCLNIIELRFEKESTSKEGEEKKTCLKNFIVNIWNFQTFFSERVSKFQTKN